MVQKIGLLCGAKWKPGSALFVVLRIFNVFIKIINDLYCVLRVLSFFTQCVKIEFFGAKV